MTRDSYFFHGSGTLRSGNQITLLQNQKPLDVGLLFLVRIYSRQHSGYRE